MPFLFSPSLIQETSNVFYEEDGILLSPETANDYLMGLSGLFLAFAGDHASAGVTLIGHAEHDAGL